MDTTMTTPKVGSLYRLRCAVWLSDICFSKQDNLFSYNTKKLLAGGIIMLVDLRENDTIFIADTVTSSYDLTFLFEETLYYWRDSKYDEWIYCFEEINVVDL